MIPIPAFAFPFSEQTYEDASYVTYDYDNSGALATVYDSETGISTTYYYDFTDRMMKYVEEGTGYSHSVGYEYDTINNLTAMVETINGVKHTTGYTYDKDNRVTAITTDGISESYTYDAYGRVSTKVTKSGSATVLTETYTYVTNSAGQPTGQVATHRTRGTGYDVTYSYTYDGNGNILSVSDGTYTTTYQYDSANQLIRENNQQAGKTWTWEYDNAGNILSEKTCAYTTGTPGSGNTQEYVYGDSPWGDLLTEYSGWDMTYDSIGNVLCGHLDDVFTWKNGRQLISYKQDGNEHEDIIHYEYNADGLRTKAYNGYTAYSYVYNGSSLVQLEISNTSTGAVTDTLYFTYDTAGTPQTVKYNGTVYYYVTNLQGDVTAILDGTGAVVVSYTYDAWGNHTSGHSGTGALASTLGRYNPLRYRGYVFDTWSELYYLQSRYYNPELGRFINADALASTGQGVLGSNMFAYCRNNPICYSDPNGLCPHDGKFYTSGPFKGKFEYNPRCERCAAHGEFYLTDSNGKSYDLTQYESHTFSQMAICTDGGTDPHNSASHQNMTAYSISGRYMDPSKIYYVVAPVYYTGVKNGDLALVIDHATGNSVFAIVGDRGPKGKFNEVSLLVAWDLGYTWADGSRGPKSDFEILYFPDTCNSWSSVEELEDYLKGW